MAALFSSSPQRFYSHNEPPSKRQYEPAYSVFAAEPPSPTVKEGDGELSPSFDVSFASAMSLTPAVNSSTAQQVSPNAMDCSPAPPLRHAATEPAPVRSDLAFFQNLASHQPPSLSPTVSPTHVRSQSTTGVPLSRASFSAAPLARPASTVPFLAPPPKSRSSSSRSLGATASYDNVMPTFKVPPMKDGAIAVREKKSSGGRSRSLFDMSWKPLPEGKKPLEGMPVVRPPLMRHDQNSLRGPLPRSPTHLSSPHAMDVDPKSPRGGDGADDQLAADFFEASPLPKPLVGPLPASRKRSMVCMDGDSSPSGLASPTPSSPLGRPPMRHTSSSTSAASGSIARRRGSNNAAAASGPRRPSLTGGIGSYHGGPGTGFAGIDEQQPLKKARPHLVRPSSSRRTQSVCDVTSNSAFDAPPRVVPAGIGLGRPQSLAIKPTFINPNAPTDERRVVSATQPQSATTAAPNTWEPAWGVNESDGKALRCHAVPNEDGLMRITADTLVDVMEGKYDALIANYLVIDCRFDYEYSGGHVAGAINLQNQEAIEDYFLNRAANDLPPASKSGEADVTGSTRKLVLIFHCEFSAKRAPTMAKYLRSKDRALNSAHYPRVCYPEVYILEGGYAATYGKFSRICDPCGYTRMDDPAHLASRHVELNDFRRRQGLSQRAKSFTYGESIIAQQSLLVAGPSSKPSSKLATVDDAPSSSGNDSLGSDGIGGDSPCPPAGPGKGKTKLLPEYAPPPVRPRTFGRAATTLNTMHHHAR